MFVCVCVRARVCACMHACECARVHIDDAPGQINALKEAGENVLIFDQPYNRHLEGPRAHNWSEVVEMVFEAQDKWTSEESN